MTKCSTCLVSLLLLYPRGRKEYSWLGAGGREQVTEGGNGIRAGSYGEDSNDGTSFPSCSQGLIQEFSSEGGNFSVR